VSNGKGLLLALASSRTYALQVSLEKLPLLVRMYERLPVAEGGWLTQPGKIKF